MFRRRTRREPTRRAPRHRPAHRCWCLPFRSPRRGPRRRQQGDAVAAVAEYQALAFARRCGPGTRTAHDAFSACASPQTKVATVTATESARTQPERPASGNGFQLQLLSSRSADDAKGAWARLRDKNADLLGSLSPSVARANLDDRGTFYRLRAGPIASETKARSICDSLAARRVSCLVVRSSG